MLDSFAFVGAFLPDDQVRVLSSENIVDNVLLSNLHEISLKFIHQGMEKFIDVSLNSGVDGLPIQDKISAQTFCRVHIVVWVFQMCKYFLNFVGDVLIIFDGLRV